MKLFHLRRKPLRIPICLLFLLTLTFRYSLGFKYILVNSYKMGREGEVKGKMRTEMLFVNTVAASMSLHTHMDTSIHLIIYLLSVSSTILFVDFKSFNVFF